MLQAFSAYKLKILNYLKPGLKLAPVLFFISCSLFESSLKKYPKIQTNYWENQINFLGRQFEASNQEISLSKKYKSYLSSLVLKIENKSKLSLDKNIDIKIIKNKYPLWYSLPNGNIIFSNSFINDYVLSESFLASILSFELARINTLAYKKHKVYPKGYIDREDFLKFFQLDLKRRVRLHKWAVINVHESDFDVHEYLNWVQTISRHHEKFSLLTLDLAQLSAEEREIKKFLTSNEGISLFQLEETKKSSSIFYSFKNMVAQVK